MIKRIIQLEKMKLIGAKEHEDTLRRLRQIGDEQRALLAALSTDEFERVRGVLYRMRVGDSLPREAIRRDSELCGTCGHRRGSHSSINRTRCAVGTQDWNRRYGRNDQPCPCLGFTPRVRSR